MYISIFIHKVLRRLSGMSFQACSCKLTGLGFIDFGLQLLGDVLLVFPGNGDEFGVAASSNNLVVFVHEFDRGVREGLANCTQSVNVVLSEGTSSLVFSHLSQITSPLTRSPIFPPELRYVTLRSVETPVA